ncbi:MAG: phosphoribosylformylglycinamidine synthase I [Candidatus Omnitrophica bacterium]|nr:phosphoribosylformylglycinamidine synthase I [Candidatus Omnitrophota bacterium]
MSPMRAAVLKAPGTNCDAETVHAFALAQAQAEPVWIHELQEKPDLLDDYQILAIPGGFTYGDDLGAGRLAANELKYRLKEAIERFLASEKLIIGICNGFQILVKAGILPGGKVGSPQEVTLTTNDSGKFEDRWVRLRPEFNVCIWTQGLEETIELPVAHGEGKFVTKDQTVLEHLLGYGQIVLHYCDPEGREAGYPWNPNGSVGGIAGICDPTGRVLGLMPHPERHVNGIQHPRWTREGRLGEGEGLQIFRNGVQWVERHRG